MKLITLNPAVVLTAMKGLYAVLKWPMIRQLLLIALLGIFPSLQSLSGFDDEWNASVDIINEEPPVVEAPEGMRWVPPGEFTIGEANRSMKTQRKARKVQIHGFWMDETEVTNAQFAAFVEATAYRTTAERPIDWDALAAQLPPGTPRPDAALMQPGSAVFVPFAVPVDLRQGITWWTRIPGTSWRHPEGPESTINGRESHPVVHVSWEDAAAYAAWAGKRLPSEDEWERAARYGHDGEPFSWGAEQIPNGQYMANIWQGEFPLRDAAEDGFMGTAPVRSFPPNALGIHDLSGNVWEWTADRHGEHNRVQKGGSFLCHDSYCQGYRPSARSITAADSSFPHVGFRCVKDPDSGGGRGRIQVLEPDE